MRGRWSNKPFGAEAEALELLLQTPRESVSNSSSAPDDTASGMDSFYKDHTERPKTANPRLSDKVQKRKGVLK